MFKRNKFRKIITKKTMDEKMKVHIKKKGKLITNITNFSVKRQKR